MNPKNLITIILIVALVGIGGYLGYRYIWFKENPYNVFFGTSVLQDTIITIDSSKKTIVASKDSTKFDTLYHRDTTITPRLVTDSLKDSMMIGSDSTSSKSEYAVQTTINTAPDTASIVESGSSSNVASGSSSSTSAVQTDKERKKLIAIYESMPPAKVAEILELEKDDARVREVIMSLKKRTAAAVMELLPPERRKKILSFHPSY